MTQVLEVPLEVPEGWKVLPEVSDAVHRNRNNAIPKIASWLVAQYMSYMSSSLQERIGIRVWATVDEEINLAPFKDFSVQDELVSFMAQRGWVVEIFSDYAYLTPMARTGEQPDTDLQFKLEAPPSAPETVTAPTHLTLFEKARTAAVEDPKVDDVPWWKIPFSAFF